MGPGSVQGLAFDISKLVPPKGQDTASQAPEKSGEPALRAALREVLDRKHIEQPASQDAELNPGRAERLETLGKVKAFLNQLNTCMQDMQLRTLEFSLSRDALPERAATELLTHLSSIGEQVKDCLADCYRHSLGGGSQNPHPTLLPNFQPEDLLFLRPLLGRFATNLATVSAHLVPLVQYPGGTGANTIEAFIKTKEVAAQVSEQIGALLNQGIHEYSVDNVLARVGHTELGVAHSQHVSSGSRKKINGIELFDIANWP